jgi:DNA-binding HxlR family transcriptional regulator
MGRRNLVPVTAADALATALARVGDRWSLRIVDALGDGPRRFADLEAALPGIATNILTQRLRHLEGERMVLAVPYSRRPRRFAYELTEAGRGLGGAVRLLAQWSAEHGGGEVQAPSHAACGSPLEARWWCPTCELVSDVEPDEVTWL